MNAPLDRKIIVVMLFPGCMYVISERSSFTDYWCSTITAVLL